MKINLLAILLILLIGCKGENGNKNEENLNKDGVKINGSEISIDAPMKEGTINLNLEDANILVELPLACINTEYPNKLNQTLSGDSDLKSPKKLHPAFYGCFDWHSSVHGHWALVNLLKQFPKLDRAEEIKEKLETSLSKENIAAEVAYFKTEHGEDYERTYGWAWVLKLSEELNTWDSDLGKELSANMKPLTDLIATLYTEFLPKLNYPIRSGEHPNTAFALSFAYDYAVTTKNEGFRTLIEERAKDFYLKDENCPITWEPSGFDFLSPCLQEVDVMRKVLPKADFSLWIDNFMPQLKNPEFTMEVGKVLDENDGKLVHLYGLNFSRAWVFYGLANQYPKEYSHLKILANQHFSYSYPILVGVNYEGGHWLGSFALYALKEAKE